MLFETEKDRAINRLIAEKNELECIINSYLDFMSSELGIRPLTHKYWDDGIYNWDDTPLWKPELERCYIKSEIEEYEEKYKKLSLKGVVYLKCYSRNSFRNDGSLIFIDDCAYDLAHSKYNRLAVDTYNTVKDIRKYLKRLKKNLENNNTDAVLDNIEDIEIALDSMD